MHHLHPHHPHAIPVVLEHTEPEKTPEERKKIAYNQSCHLIHSGLDAIRQIDYLKLVTRSGSNYWALKKLNCKLNPLIRKYAKTHLAYHDLPAAAKPTPMYNYREVQLVEHLYHLAEDVRDHVDLPLQSIIDDIMVECRKAVYRLTKLD